MQRDTATLAASLFMEPRCESDGHRVGIFQSRADLDADRIWRCRYVVVVGSQQVCEHLGCGVIPAAHDDTCLRSAQQLTSDTWACHSDRIAGVVLIETVPEDVGQDSKTGSVPFEALRDRHDWCVTGEMLTQRVCCPLDAR